MSSDSSSEAKKMNFEKIENRHFVSSSSSSPVKLTQES